MVSYSLSGEEMQKLCLSTSKATLASPKLQTYYKPRKNWKQSEIRILFCPLSLLRGGQSDHLPSLRGDTFLLPFNRLKRDAPEWEWNIELIDALRVTEHTAIPEQRFNPAFITRSSYKRTSQLQQKEPMAAPKFGASSRQLWMLFSKLHLFAHWAVQGLWGKNNMQPCH